jgi:folate-dependent phosphoribosylglycinamide formyltransferase PurN
MSQIVFFSNGMRPTALGRMARIVVMTSLRDIALCDRNGQIIATPDGQRYMEGIVQHVVRQTLPGGALYRMVQVAGVITDDLPRDLRGYPAVPTLGQPWIHPLDLHGPDRELIADLTVNIPSSFRALPLSDVSGRRAAKLDFERQVHALAKRLRADVLVSDHYMARIEYLHQWFPGRVLNIHPGITLPGHTYRFPGKTPTADAIARAGRELGVRTGATLHLVDSEIDHGPAIAFSEATPVHAADEPQHLRFRNYQTAKLPVFVAGLVHYLTAIYPYLDRLDLSKLAPVPG